MTAQDLARWRIALTYPELLIHGNQWLQLCIDAARMAAVSKRIVRAEARRETRKWVDKCLEGAASAGHKFVKGGSGAPIEVMDVPCTLVDEVPTYVTDPNEAVEIRGRKWHELWGRDDAQYEDLTRMMNKERLACIDEDAEQQVCMQQVEAGIKKCSADTVPGTDGWTGREFRMLPEAALQELANLMTDINRWVSWPAQVLDNIIVLLRKAVGGERPICLAAGIVKLWEAIHFGTVDEWESSRAGFWDDAIKGSSALRAAALRRLEAETATLLGEEFCFVLWDAEKFYDNIDMMKLYKLSADCGMDRRQMLLGMQVLMAPRRVKIGKVMGLPIRPMNGMTAGLKRSNLYARFYFHNFLDTMHRRYPDAAPR